MDDLTAHDTQQAGTGFMESLSTRLIELSELGYDANLVQRFDHFECHVGAIKIFPGEFVVDKVVRFENSSDPDDNSILYALSVAGKNIKGVYVESYGIYHESLSPQMLQNLSVQPDAESSLSGTAVQQNEKAKFS